MALQSIKAMRQEAYDGNGDGLVDKAQGDHIFIEAGAGGVSAFAVVMMALDGTVLPGNSSEPSHFGKIIGISNSQKLEGDDCDIMTSCPWFDLMRFLYAQHNRLRGSHYKDSNKYFVEKPPPKLKIH
jgi:hypothetical protein